MKALWITIITCSLAVTSFAHDYVQKILKKGDGLKIATGQLFLYSNGERHRWVYYTNTDAPVQIPNSKQNYSWQIFKLKKNKLDIGKKTFIGLKQNQYELVTEKETKNLPNEYNTFIPENCRKIDIKNKRIAVMVMGFEEKDNPLNPYEPPTPKYYHKLAAAIKASYKASEVFLFSYNTYVPIEKSGEILGQRLNTLIQAGAIVDLFTYSTGGLVARAALELYLYKKSPEQLKHVKNLVTLATPHLGAPGGISWRGWINATEKWRPSYNDYFFPSASHFLDKRVDNSDKKKLIDQLNFFDDVNKVIPTQYHLLVAHNPNIVLNSKGFLEKAGYMTQTLNYLKGYAMSDSDGWHQHDGRVPCFSQIGNVYNSSKTGIKESFSVFSRITQNEPKIYRVPLSHWTLFPALFYGHKMQSNEKLKKLINDIDQKENEESTNKTYLLKKAKYNMHIFDPVKKVSISIDHITQQFQD